MIPQDKEIMLLGDLKAQQEMAKMLGIGLLVLGKDIPLLTDPRKRAAADCAFCMRKEEDLTNAMQERHIRYLFGFDIVLPKLTQVHAKQLAEHRITLVFPFGSKNQRFLVYERKILHVLEKYGVSVLYACLESDPVLMRARHEKEAYYRMVLFAQGKDHALPFT